MRDMGELLRFKFNAKTIKFSDGMATVRISKPRSTIKPCEDCECDNLYRVFHFSQYCLWAQIESSHSRHSYHWWIDTGPAIYIRPSVKTIAKLFHGEGVSLDYPPKIYRII